jgi:hypothetical protein
VTVDASDQWGKMASASPCGLGKDQRTFTVIMFNNKDDYDLASAAISDNMRYVDSDNKDTVSSGYWGDSRYGRNALVNTFEKYVISKSSDVNAFKKLFYGSFTKNRSTVSVKVTDYTN